MRRRTLMALLLALASLCLAAPAQADVTAATATKAVKWAVPKFVNDLSGQGRVHIHPADRGKKPPKLWRTFSGAMTGSLTIMYKRTARWTSYRKCRFDLIVDGIDRQYALVSFQEGVLIEGEDAEGCPSAAKKNYRFKAR